MAVEMKHENSKLLSQKLVSLTLASRGHQVVEPCESSQPGNQADLEVICGRHNLKQILK